MENSTPPEPAALPPNPATEWVNVRGSTAANTPNKASDGPEAREQQQSPPAKRRREDRERTRVSRACDRCKKKKTRCTGRCPCTLCLKSGLPCEFTASYTRGRLPSVIVDEAAMAASTRPRVSLPTVVSVQEAPPKESLPTPSFQFQKPPRSPRTNPSPSTSAGDVFSRDRLAVPHEDSTLNPPSRTSPEPAQTDQQGHYVGPASGVSFLLRIQKRLHQNSSLSHDSSIFTFGDAPLPEFDPTFFVLPPKADAQRLVERYFDFAAPTHRFLHRPTIEGMLEEFYETQGDMRNREEAPAKTALLLIVFAQAQAYMPSGSTEHDNSARYYFASEHQLSKERGAVRLASVQARLGQCFYLLAQSRINHCWSLFGTTAHLALAIGLNRGRRCDPSASTDYIELESRRRLFWVAYTLDKYLAAALGRPRTFKDEDIDQELPTVINDTDLHSNALTPHPANSPTIPVMMAPVEHIKLSRIVSLVLRDLYPIRPPSIPLRIELAAKYTKDLHAWRSNLTRFLDASADLPSSLLIPIYQRQRNVLNLAYYHAVLLVHRPFLLSNFASLTHIENRTASNPATTIASNAPATTTTAPPSPFSNTTYGSGIDTSANVRECLAAALGIVRVVEEIASTQLFRAFWFTQYYAFCAVVVLYIYRIQQGSSNNSANGSGVGAEAAKQSEAYYAAGQRCQAVLNAISDVDCLSKRYCLVLEELRLEAERQGAGGGAVGPGQGHARQTAATNGTPTSFAASASSPGAGTLSAPGPASTNLSVPATSTTPQRDASPAYAGSPYYGGGTTTVPPTPESAVFNTSFLPTSSIMADLTSWGQFDSLVTAGIGMLDGGFEGGGMLSFGLS